MILSMKNTLKCLHLVSFSIKIIAVIRYMGYKITDIFATSAVTAFSPILKITACVCARECACVCV